MLKKILNKKIQIISMFLFVVLMSAFILNTFSSSIMCAKAEGEIFGLINGADIDYDKGFQENEADEYFSSKDISDSDIEDVDNYIEEKYGKYVCFDKNNSDYLIFDTSYFETLYGPIFLYGEVDSEYYSEEELFEIFAGQMINKNIKLMNQLVKEGFGYINENYEMVLYIEDEYVQQWALWGVKWKWNKVTMNMDSDAAIVVALVTLGLRTIFHGADIQSTMAGLESDAALVAVLQECFLVLPSDIASGVVGLFSDPVINILANAFSILLTVAGNSSIFIKVLTLAISIFLPSIPDGILVLYNACKYDKGVELKGCWIPTWKDKWGVSIKSL